MCDTIDVDPTVYTGSPAVLESLDAPLEKCYSFLNKLGISFKRVEHEPAMTIAACEKIDGLLGLNMCKNLFLCNRQETDFYLLLLPGNKPFKTKDLSKQLGVARLSFANEGYLKEYLGLTPGSVTVLGLMNDTQNKVRLLIDEELLKEKYLGCHPCLNTASLAIDMQDLVNIILPAMAHTYTPVSL